jgi:hypothetical protein
MSDVDLTIGNTYGNNMGNWKNFNCRPGEEIVRSRFIEASAIGGETVSTMSEGVEYKIFQIPSYYFVKRVDAIVTGSCSEATGGVIAVGDGDASTTWISDMSASALGPPGASGINASLGGWDSYLGASHLLTGKFYSNGGEINIAATSHEGTAKFWVTVEMVNLTPV